MAAKRPRGLSAVRRTKPQVEETAAPDLSRASVSEQKLNAYRKRRYEAQHTTPREIVEKRRAQEHRTAHEHSAAPEQPATAPPPATGPST